MALVDVIKKETPQETAKRLALIKAKKSPSKVKINSSKADMIKKEAVEPKMLWKRGADISNLNETEKGYNSQASNSDGNLDVARLGNTLAMKSSEPANFEDINPTTDEQYSSLRDQFIPVKKGGGFDGTTKTLVNTAMALGKAADAAGITDVEQFRANIGMLAKKAGIDPKLIEEMGEDGSKPFGDQMIHGGFNFIRGLKKAKPEVLKPGALVGVSAPEIIK
jgi:hypothetical protein